MIDTTPIHVHRYTHSQIKLLSLELTRSRRRPVSMKETVAILLEAYKEAKR